MLLLAINRSVGFALQSFWRNIWLSLATIFIIFLAFISINFLVFLTAVSDTAVAAVKDKIDISIYFKPDIREAKITEVKSHLETLPQVKAITYLSSEQNLENFKARHLGETVIEDTLKELEGNPLGATLTIRAKELADYPEILKAVDNPAYNDLIESKNYDDHRVVIDRINSITKSVRQGGLIISLIFIVIAILIVFNTVRIAIFTHQTEIGIMKLVGASNWFIRAPFVIESILLGLIGCLLAIAVLYPILSLVQPYVSNFFDGATFNLAGYFNQHFLLIFGSQFLGIIIINIFSSILAISKYLKV